VRSVLIAVDVDELVKLHAGVTVLTEDLWTVLDELPPDADVLADRVGSVVDNAVSHLNHLERLMSSPSMTMFPRRLH
jgi:hypothetical protein